MSTVDVPGEQYFCLGCGNSFSSNQARLDCEARHVAEELLAVGCYPSWLAGFGGPPKLEDEE